MKKYTTLFFDLDNTILDFYASERSAIKALLKMHGLPNGDEQAREYSEINQSYWERFEKGEIKIDEIFTGRFHTLLERLSKDGNPLEMSKDYFNLFSCGHDIIPMAKEVLHKLKKRGYTICITTNGLAKTQYKRIKESGLSEFFDFIFVSEETGHQKPEKEYFEYVYENTAEKDKSKILVIGDSQSSDILGGINFGVDTCWINNRNGKRRYESTYEILKLEEILNILD